ncbi:DUF3667 domain-containing protein [Kaistella palustris]|uniref:DUF3667 domain-containing protein n=1 Tax=Kaistella palustris TaxID=493376 RepID=UPI000481103A|nr:DUF3667 domain-containing protein [Kaistella palustris]
MKNSEERCKNCGQHLILQQNFCHECGQKTDTHRINFHYFVHEVPHSIFHIDGGIIFTLKELFTRPGHSIREYLEGKRKPHFRPVMLVLVLGSVCALIQYFLHKKSPEDNDKLIQTNLAKTEVARYVDLEGLVSFFKEIVHWLSSHLAFTILLMLPITALGFYLGFRKYKINYPEWVVIFLFLSGQSLAVYIFFIFLNHFVGHYSGIFLLLVWGLITFSLLQFFQGHNKKHIILRTLWSAFLSYLLTFVYFVFVCIILGVAGILLYGYDNIIPVFFH